MPLVNKLTDEYEIDEITGEITRRPGAISIGIRPDLSPSSGTTEKGRSLSQRPVVEVVTKAELDAFDAGLASAASGLRLPADAARARLDLDDRGAITPRPEALRHTTYLTPPPPSPQPSSRRPSPSVPPPSLRSAVSSGPFPAAAPTLTPTSRSRPAGESEPDEAAAPTFADHLAEALRVLGIDTAFGITGGSVGYMISALDRAKLNVVHCRHEAGAVFAAVEVYYGKDRPACVFVTTGPGLMNALTGIAAAKRDGAKIILISGATSAPQRGRWAFQETSHYTMPVSGLFTAGPLFDYAATIEQPVELYEAFRRIASGFQKPGGFAVHLSLPLTTQICGEMEPLSAGPISMLPLRCADHTATECVEILEEESFAIWVGMGARKAWRQVRELARRTGAPVMCSPRAKGIFPEDHPQFIGVTGFGGHEGVFDYMSANRPSYILVLGTRLGEFTSFWSPDLIPTKAFIHVDIDREVPGAAYPDASTIGIQADIRSFLDALLARLPEGESPRQYAPIPRFTGPDPSPRPGGSVRPDFLMHMIQRVIVEGTDAPIITEAGNSFAWGTNMLRFRNPGCYRVSTGFGSMGHAVTGVLGMAMARRGKAVAIAGDGAMLMNSELSTAVQYEIPAVWIVLNDSSYGMIHQGMKALRMEPVATAIPKTDFVMIARGMGADGIRVESEADLVAALEQAMRAPGPFVVDVVIDPSVPAPAGRRNKSLTEQAHGG